MASIGPITKSLASLLKNMAPPAKTMQIKIVRAIPNPALSFTTERKSKIATN